MLLWLMFGAHPARVPRRLGSTRPLSATRPGKRALLVFAMPARSDWLHAHAIRRKRPDVHDVDVRARAETSAVCARVRARLRVVECVRLSRRHLALRCRRADLGVDRAPSLLHARGGWATRRWASALGCRPARRRGRAGNALGYVTGSAAA